MVIFVSLSFIFLSLHFLLVIKGDPENLEPRLSSLAFSLWIFSVIFTGLYYRIRIAESKSLQISYPMSPQEAYIFLGGIKYFSGIVLVCLLPILFFIVYMVLT